MYKDHPFSKKNFLCCLLASLLTHVPFFSQQPFWKLPWHDSVILPTINLLSLDPLDCTGLISFYPAFSIFNRPGAHPKPRNMTPGQASRLRPGGVGGDCQRSERRLGGAETLEDGWVQTKMGKESTQQPTSVLERSTIEITNNLEIQASLEFHCGTSLCVCNMLVQWSALAESYPVDSIFDHQGADLVIRSCLSSVG